jgi:ribosomal protein L37E
MNAYFFNMTPEERSSILDKHKELYNGYQALQPVGNNSNPLYTQDFANDKHGLTLSNKNVVKRYTNTNINESDMKKGQTCEQCGAKGVMKESETCEQCGYKGGVAKKFTGKFDYVEGEMEEQGGNAPDMNVDNVDSAFDFESHGPVDVYDEDDKNYFDDNLNIFDDEDLMSARAFYDDEDGNDDGFSAEDILMNIRTKPESLGMDTSNDMDLSNVEEPYNFGTGGPMQHSSGFREEVEEEDYFDLNVDEDLQESFTKQKNKITEMFDRMKRY